MARMVTAEIKLDAIKQNYLYAKSVAAPAKVIAVIKANAYGHGAVEVANTLADVADAYAVACIEEAKELRDAGIKSPILLLEGFFSEDELAYISEYDLWCVIHCQFQLDALQKAILPKPINVWLKMDSGMHRLGFLPEDYANAWQQLTAMQQVNHVVHMSHFSSADDLTSSRTQQQTRLFLDTVNELPGEISLANSSAILSNAVKGKSQWVRAGIMLYGASPIKNEYSMGLMPTMLLKSKVISQHLVHEGEGVGYNALWIADKATKIGTVSIGYADGYPRHANNGTPVFINGQKSQILGRVSMDMLMVDLSMFEHENCIGFDVELWGENVLVNDVAKCADTISYDLFCGLTRRVNKLYCR
jgi:alanine racemase